jgi:thioester reductase-like protein
VTGATGFLGQRLAAELLTRMAKGARLHCVVRAGSEEQARRRLGPLAADPRVVAHAGDVSAPRLGLSEACWRELTDAVGQVAHAAAAVSLAQPFEALAATNVRGAVEVARFVRSGASKKLLHVSSLAVLAASNLPLEVLDEKTHPPASAMVCGPYPQTKRLAEDILRRTVPALTIVRPGLLTGDSRTGVGALTCPLQTFLRAVTTLGCAPGVAADRLRVDVTPVDAAARAIAEILVADGAAPVVHVATERGVALIDVLEAIRRVRPLTVVSREEFLRAARTSLPRDHALAVVVSAHRLLGTDAHRDADLFLHTGRRFPCSVLERVTGHGVPEADAALLSRYVDHARGGAG